LRKTRGNIISAGSEGGVNGQARNTAYGGTKGISARLHDGRRGRAGTVWKGKKLVKIQ